MSKLLLALTILLLPASAAADDHDGLGVGPRREGYASGVGVDLRRGDTTFGIFLGGAVAGSDYWTAGSLAASFGVQQVIASHGRAELSVGARVELQRFRQEQGEAFVTTQQLALQVPVRLTIWVTDHVSVFSEIGAEVRRSSSSSDYEGAGVVSEDASRSAQLFGDPLMNFGLSYQF